MSIHTVPVAKNTYVRINQFAPGMGLRYMSKFIGQVGMVTCRGTGGHNNIAFVNIMNESYVFNVSNLEYITEKEYFIGVLGG